MTADQQTQPIRILHLSDIHFRSGRAWDADPVLRKLVKRVRDDVQSGLIPDLVAFTGDLAFSGAADQYEAATGWLKGQLWPVLEPDLPHDRLLIVPGNHDVDREKVRRGSHHTQQELLEKASQHEIATVLQHDDDRADMLARHAAWSAFVETWFGTPRPLCWNRRDLTIRGTRLHIAELNSAWMSCGDKDYGRLLLGRLQLNQTVQIAQAEDADWRLVLMHHPWSYLAEFDQDEARANVHEHADLVLRGHLHKPASERIAPPDPTRSCLELAAGSIYEDSQYPNAFQWIELAPDPRSVRVHFRAWLHNDWQIDRNQPGGPQGWVEFSLQTGTAVGPAIGRSPADGPTGNAEGQDTEREGPDPQPDSDQEPDSSASGDGKPQREKAARFERLRRGLIERVRRSQSALNELEQVLGLPDDPGISTDQARAERLVDELMAADLARAITVLVTAYSQLRDKRSADGAEAITGAARLLIPWLFIATTGKGKKTDEAFWAALGAKEPVELPTKLDSFAEIVMAGLDRWEADFRTADGEEWPVGRHAVDIPKLPSGRANYDIPNFRSHLYQHASAPPAYDPEEYNDGTDLSEVDQVIDRSFARKQKRTNRTAYVILREPKWEDDLPRHRQLSDFLSSRYENFVVVELKNLMPVEDVDMFSEIEDLIYPRPE